MLAVNLHAGFLYPYARKTRNRLHIVRKSVHRNRLHRKHVSPLPKTGYKRSLPSSGVKHTKSCPSTFPHSLFISSRKQVWRRAQPLALSAGIILVFVCPGSGTLVKIIIARFIYTILSIFCLVKPSPKLCKHPVDH